MKRNFLILLFLFGIQCFSQNETDSLEDQVYTQIFKKCFPEVKGLPEVKNRAKLNKIQFCSLYQCVHYIEYVEYEEKIQNAILKRAVEIAALLYKNGTPVYLAMGMNSSDKALMKNVNLKDDNKLVYVSIAECTVSSSLIKISEAVNKATMELINNSKSFKQKNKTKEVSK